MPYSSLLQNKLDSKHSLLHKGKKKIEVFLQKTNVLVNQSNFIDLNSFRIKKNAVVLASTVNLFLRSDNTFLLST